MEAPLHHDDAVAAALQCPPAAAQCPRCASRDTKFCYYNNYNTAQPRHFCRSCRRYWTLGGSLRNVPVGGATRKRPRPPRARRAAIAIAAATATATASTIPLFAASPEAAPMPATAQSGGGLLSALLLGSAAPLLAPVCGAALGLGATAGAGGLAQLGLGAGPLPWPATVLESDRAETTTWNDKTSGDVLPPAAALWQELTAAAPVLAGGLRHGAPHLLR